MFAECNNFEEICCIMLLCCSMMGCRKNMVICRGRRIFILLRKMYQMGRQMGRLLRRSTKTTQDQYKVRRVRICNAIIILIIKMMLKITKIYMTTNILLMLLMMMMAQTAQSCPITAFLLNIQPALISLDSDFVCSTCHSLMSHLMA